LNSTASMMIKTLLADGTEDRMLLAHHIA